MTNFFSDILCSLQEPRAHATHLGVDMSLTSLAERIRVEYQTMPGLKLSKEQACRMWGVDGTSCDAALQKLIDEGFLHRTATERYIALPRPAGRAIRTADAERTVATTRCPHCLKLNTIEQDRAHPHLMHVSFRCVACHRIFSLTAIPA
jgi:hypothetical protein